MTEVYIGKYRVLRMLGSGGMASVYLASHRDIPNLRTVLKELSDPNLADRFRQEADKLALLDGHSGICQIKHFFDVDDRFYIVMEFIDGPTIEELVQSESPPDIERSTQIVLSVLDTLAFAHSNGVVHRDIKPTNIMVDKRGQVKVIDFGIAKSEADPDLTRAGESVGTPRYMPLEQFNSSAEIDWVRCDIYAVGVMLHYMLTREVPFKGSNVFEMCEAKRVGSLEAPSKLNPAIPSSLDAIVLKATASDPSNRFPSVADMRSALMNLDSSEGASVIEVSEPTMVPEFSDPTPPPAPVVPPTAPPAKHEPREHNRRLPAIIGGSVAVIALAVWGFLQLGVQDPNSQPVDSTVAENYESTPVGADTTSVSITTTPPSTLPEEVSHQPPEDQPAADIELAQQNEEIHQEVVNKPTDNVEPELPTPDKIVPANRTIRITAWLDDVPIPNAKIYINGINSDQVTAFSFDWDPGTYTIELSASIQGTNYTGEKTITVDMKTDGLQKIQLHQ